MTQLSWGVGNPLKWGDFDLLWGKLPDFVADTAIVAALVRADYTDGTTLAVWTGTGPLDINAITYSGVGTGILEISNEEASLDGGGRMRVKLVDVAREQQIEWLDDPGRVVVTFNLVYSEDGGQSYQLVPRGFTGLLSSAELDGATYAFDIETSDADVDRGFVAVWDDATQRELHNGDLGFEHIATIFEGRVLKWPPPTA